MVIPRLAERYGGERTIAEWTHEDMSCTMFDYALDECGVGAQVVPLWSVGSVGSRREVEDAEDVGQERQFRGLVKDLILGSDKYKKDMAALEGQENPWM